LIHASIFADARKAFTIKRGDDGEPDAELCREVGISQATLIRFSEDCSF